MSEQERKQHNHRTMMDMLVLLFKEVVLEREAHLIDALLIGNVYQVIEDDSGLKNPKRTFYTCPLLANM